MGYADKWKIGSFNNIFIKHGRKSRPFCSKFLFTAGHTWSAFFHSTRVMNKGDKFVKDV